jgi:hypothetical protein
MLELTFSDVSPPRVRYGTSKRADKVSAHSLLFHARPIQMPGRTGIVRDGNNDKLFRRPPYARLGHPSSTD